MTRTTFFALALLGSASALTLPAQAAPTQAEVAMHYADVALAKYSDSLATAQTLKDTVDAFIAAPGEETLKAARTAWIAARVPYQQTEVYRFGNPIVDDWEGRVNAWPLDEGLIDYVDPSYGAENDENSLFTANVIANPSITINGEPVDASNITPDLLANTLQEAGDVEANVATGYHAIEFLLWGQDLNGTGPGAGNRPYTDYLVGEGCTNGHCDRRVAYLQAATDLLVSDLQEMVGNWEQSGAARKALADDPKSAMATILTGMGSLSYGELAGQRMKLGLLLHDPEEEHDCFSDNTANSNLYDTVGIADAYTGTYTRPDGSKLSGASISDLVAEKDPALDAELKGKLSKSVELMHVLTKRSETVEAYDQMIGEGNPEGNAVVQAAIDGLIDQTRSIERAMATLDLGAVALEGSDSLDNPNAVFQ